MIPSERTVTSIEQNSSQNGVSGPLFGGANIAQLNADPAPADVAEYLLERGWLKGHKNRWVLKDHVFTWEQALIYSMWNRFYLQSMP